MDPDWIVPRWPAPARVRAVSTTRVGGVSRAPYDTLNLGGHVGDDSGAVAANRELLAQALRLPAEPTWLQQVHGTQVMDAAAVTAPVAADASYALETDVVCAVLTADCLPVLLCDRGAGVVAAAHAGWRGLAAGVIERTLTAMRVPGSELLVWLGPSIGAVAYVVGDEVRDTFLAHDPVAAAAFRPAAGGGWHADLYLLARQRLQSQGVNAVYGGEFCTFQEASRFYSFRRDGITGRMASLIWLQDM